MMIIVALLAEGVDRNCCALCIDFTVIVALLAEGVDRNSFMFFSFTLCLWSPSSRRAWIEIHRLP